MLSKYRKKVMREKSRTGLCLDVHNYCNYHVRYLLSPPGLKVSICLRAYDKNQETSGKKFLTVKLKSPSTTSLLSKSILLKLSLDFFPYFQKLKSICEGQDITSSTLELQWKCLFFLKKKIKWFLTSTLIKQNLCLRSNIKNIMWSLANTIITITAHYIFNSV